MLLDQLVVAPDGRASLGVGWAIEQRFGHGLAQERVQQGELHLPFGQQVLGNGEEVVGEVARKNRCQVEPLPIG